MVSYGADKGQIIPVLFKQHCTVSQSLDTGHPGPAMPSVSCVPLGKAPNLSEPFIIH